MLLDEIEQARFWSRVDIRGPDECWPWLAGKSKGYGVIEIDGRSHKAHRISWSIENGAIPAGRLICHECDNPPCVNPAHLFDGTHKDNSDDKIAKGRDRKATGADHPNVKEPWRVTGERNPNAVLTVDDVRSIRTRAASGEAIASLAREWSLSEAGIRNLVKRRTWKHIAEDGHAKD